MAKPVSRFQNLLEKWLSGHFRRTDEAEWKAVSAEDDFAREALEGYASMSEDNHTESLDRLRNRLRQQTGNQAPAGFGLAPGRWMAIAASFAALLGAFWFFQHRMDTAKEAASVAQTAPLPAPPPAGAEAAGDERNTASASDNTEKEVADKKPAPSLPPTQKPEAPKTTADHYDARQGEPSGANTPAAAEPVAASAPASEDALATRETETPKPVLVPESMPSKAKILRDEAKSAKKMQQPADVKFDTDKAPEKLKKESIPDDAQPSSGWDAYMEYLRLNARLTDEARNKNISGAVRLQFTIDDNGQPQQFVILKSLGYGCDEEAIRLVKEGSEWEPGRKKTVTLDIKFVR